MIYRPILEAYKNIMSVQAMKEIAQQASDYLDFVNSFPNIEKVSDPKLIYTFNVLAANLAKREKRTPEYMVHVKLADEAKQDISLNR